MLVDLSRDELLKVCSGLSFKIARYDEIGEHDKANETQDLRDRMADLAHRAKFVDMDDE